MSDTSSPIYIGKGCVMDAFLEIFGTVPTAATVTALIALFFIFRIYKKYNKLVIDNYKKEEEKENKIQKLLEQIEMYPVWRQQSIDKQQQIDQRFEEFTKSISELKSIQQDNTKKLEEIEINNAKREQNKIRSKLLQWYSYYTGHSNPMHAWTEMEADAFWRLFKDYDDTGGDGYIHTEVQPAMNLLIVIPMSEKDQITELMKSRK